MSSGIVQSKVLMDMVEYIFTLEDGASHRFEVNIDRGLNPATDTAEHAAWTKLDFNQCSNCPLKPDRHHRCPPAVDLEKIVPIFQKLLSYQKVSVEVRTPERTYSKQCDVQTGLASLLGLVMASSACPILSRLKGLAHYHLPFATVEETVFRTTAAYLLGQYFRYKGGHSPDQNLSGLDELYKQLRILNQCFKKRIEATSEQDANMNAIVSLWAISMGVTYSLEDQLNELKPHFCA